MSFVDLGAPTTLLFVVITVVYAYFLYRTIPAVWLWCRARYMLRHLPRSTEETSTLLGCSDKATGPHRHFTYIEDAKKGAVIAIRLAWIQMILINDPHLLTEVLEHPKFAKSIRYLYDAFSELLGSSEGTPDLITAEGGPKDEMWKLLRKGIAPAFTVQNVKQTSFPIVANKGRALVEFLHKRGPKTPVEVANMAMCATIDIIGEWGFGVDLATIPTLYQSDKNSLVQIIATANQHGEKRLSTPAYKFFGGKGYKEGQVAVVAFQKVVDDIYQQVVERQEELKKGTSVAGHLFRIKDQHGQPLSPQLIKAQIAVLFWAGHDTTGNTVAWTLFAIARYPEIESRVVAELKGLGLLASPGEPKPREPVLDDLNKLPYLNAVLKESMRYFAAVPSVTTRINRDEDVTLSSGLVIPRNTTVAAILGVLNFSPLAFKDPHKFDPERWLEPNADYIKVEYKEWQSFPGAEGRVPLASSGSPVSARDEDSTELKERGFVRRYMPFSYGRRDCVGQTLAKLSVVSHLVRVLANFHFRLAEELVGPPSQVEADQSIRITLSPGKGLWMYAEPRSGQLEVA